MIGVEWEEEVREGEREKVWWVFGEGRGESEEKVKGDLVGGGGEMISGWSRNGVEMRENMGVKGMRGMEEYLGVKDEKGEEEGMVEGM